MLRTVPLSIISILFTVHSAMVYVIQVCRQLSSRILILLESCLQTCMTYALVELQWINSLWWTEELSATCRVSCQNKFENLVHLVGCIIKKFVTMHGHMNVKFYLCSFNIIFIFVFLFCISVFYCVYSMFLYRFVYFSPFVYTSLFPLIVQVYRPLPTA
jgi:hypothetical protein